MPSKFINCWTYPLSDLLLAALSTTGKNNDGEKRELVKFQVTARDLENFTREHHELLCLLLTRDEFETATSALTLLCRAGYVLEQAEVDEFVVTIEGFQRGQEIVSEHFSRPLEQREDFERFSTSFNKRFAVAGSE